MTTSPSDAVVQDLLQHLEEDPALAAALQSSLTLAQQHAEAKLAPALYAALDWPTTIEDYAAFLLAFARWIPQQSDDPAWLDPGTDEHQEVYDRLCHFYFLVDQPVGPGGAVVQDLPWFSQWLVRYARAWGTFLDTTESFSDEILQTFIDDSPEYEVENSMIEKNGKLVPNNPSGWLTFNQFFARELNPGLRPIYIPDDNRIVACPADCTFKAQYAIDAESRVPEITMKRTHRYASIHKLLEGSPYSGAFANGTFVHYFLGPYSYHRFHTPVAGRVMESRAVQGRVFLDVNLTDGQFDAPDSAKRGYEFNQMRGIITIDTAGSPYGDIGVVAVIPVGMCQVSSVNMVAVAGSRCEKGDEFGFFLFGGSDIIILFQEKAKPHIDASTDYRHYGTPMAWCL